ncbi:MAG: PASTA domain-containing protein [Actinomycetota bacterium]|nr:PASTA domain-containing protein [Actinomycetota bacterium]
MIYALLGAVALALVVAGFVTWSFLGNKSPVPDVLNVDEGVARASLAQAGFVIEVAERRFNVLPAGTVLEQDPAPGTTLKRGDAVIVVVSAGSEEIIMPDVIGSSINVARPQLEQLGLVVKIDAMESDAPRDTIISTNPSAGATLRTAEIVRVTIATEGSATNALLPYALEGVSVLIDPSVVTDGSVDAPLEVTRRLQSLLEASGATVSVTRSGVAADTSQAARVRAAEAASFDVAIGLDVASSGAGGLTLSVSTDPSGDPPLPGALTFIDELSTQLRATDATVNKRAATKDPVLGPTGAPAARVGVGSTSSGQDVSAFRDPAWRDTIARALYRAIGERFGRS